MKHESEKIYYHRHLPHYQPLHASYFITFRLSGSLPVQIIKQYKLERMMREKMIKDDMNNNVKNKIIEIRKKYFQKFDQLLDRCEIGPDWMRDPEIADIVREALHFRDGSQYNLHAYTIMPNHVHLVFDTNSTCDDSMKGISQYPVSAILENLKWYTALKANQQLNRRGTFWQQESYDHVIRNQEEFNRIVRYVINNPVKAGLVAKWEDYPYIYCKYDEN